MNIRRKLIVIMIIPASLCGEELKGTIYKPNTTEPARESTYWVENSAGKVIIPRETSADGHYSVEVEKGSEITVHAQSWSSMPGYTEVTIRTNPTTANVRLLPRIDETGSYSDWFHFGEFSARQYRIWSAGGFNEEEKKEAASLVTTQQLRKSKIPAKYIYGYLSGAKSTGGPAEKALRNMEILSEDKQSNIIKALALIDDSYSKDSILPTYEQVIQDSGIPISEAEYAEILGFIAPPSETPEWSLALDKAQVNPSTKEKVVNTSNTVSLLFQQQEE